MNYMKFFKMQTTLIVLGVIGLILGAIGLTYAIFVQVDTNTVNQTVSTGSLIVAYNKGTTLTAAMKPMSNTAGLALPGYSFSVQNAGTLKAGYKIKIHNNTDEPSSNYLSHAQLMISLDGGTPKLLSTVTKENPAAVLENDMIYIVHDGLVSKATTNNHNIRIWIKEDADESIVGKGINMILEVVSIVNESVTLTNLIPDGSFTGAMWNTAGTLVTDATVPFGTRALNSNLSLSGATITGLGINTFAGHIYYLTCMAKANVSDITFDADMFMGSVYGGIVDPSPLSSSVWSRRGTTSLTATNTLVSSISFNKNYDFRVTGLMVFDLTAAFGAGNEPTKAQMDSLVNANGGYWDGAKSVVRIG